MLVQRRAPASTRSITTRLCLRCGYDGEELQPANENPVYSCPCCCEDLYARPPKSYAQLELISDWTLTPRSRYARIRSMFLAGPRLITSRLARLIRPHAR